MCYKIVRLICKFTVDDREDEQEVITITWRNKNVFSDLVKDASELDDITDSGVEFHRTGTTTIKERSPYRVCLL